MPRVWIDRLDGEDYLRAVREGLEFIGFGQLASSTTRVFVKPNLTFPTYRPGVMTNPRCVEAVIIALRDYTDHVFIGDSDSGGYNPFPMEEVYSQIGMVDFAARHGATLVNLTRLPRKAIPLRLGRRESALEMPKLLTDEIDLLVTVPVPKIHMNTQVSLTFKNQWGCIPEPSDRLRLHPYFASTVLQVNQAVHARVAVVDGTFGLTGSGPMKGDPVPLGWVLASDDLGAAARMCCRIMQVPLGRAGHLRLGERRGLVPSESAITCNTEVARFVAGTPFRLRRRWTDYPGLFAFRSRALAYLAYFSPLAGALHRLLYLFREPFYDYGSGKAFDEGDEADVSGPR